MNRLGEATSPYLLQHKDNPVHWWQWGPDAFAEARERDVPILLSVGYSACHWCHVMAHESFEDEQTAAYMNAHYVNIKVDREERPDVDAVYMEATQAMTGSGGWPMTCFLTPKGDPFYCGTYFPPSPRHGLPSFRQLLQAIGEAWNDRRAEIVRAGADIVSRLSTGIVKGEGPPDTAAIDRAIASLGNDFDQVNGGFGGAPKFPPSMLLEFLLRHAARTQDEDVLSMVELTCERMARGGMYDQLGGGFARYSVDNRWVVPHFEKMLYDNALLLRVYLHWWRLTGSALAERVVRETADFLLRDLRTEQGGFASALDADSEGVEGKFYVWTPAKLREALGDADAAVAQQLFLVTDDGTFEHGSSTLQLPQDSERFEEFRQRLFDVRAQRVPPGRDDKVVAAWNGLAIAALAEAGALLDEPAYVETAIAAANLLHDLHTVDGRLVRTSRDGKPGTSSGVLEDYANVAEGSLTLLAVTGDARWLDWAKVLLGVVLDHFEDPEHGLYDTADDAEQLVRRPQDPTDNATPSGRSAAAGALLTYAAYTGEARHREAAERALGVTGLLADHAPRAAGWGLAVAEAALAGPLEIAIVGDPDDPRRKELFDTALQATSPGAVIVAGTPADGEAPIPLLAHRTLLDGKPAAYVCRGFVCDRPVSSPEELKALL
jgi:uncharacterized protein YyaL (SSP411 family)